MALKYLLLPATVIFSMVANACTCFLLSRDKELVFGRNYDWITGAGMVFSNPRGLLKISMETGDGATLTWTSKYGSVTFNQYGREFPTGGMNEKGLVVELMWLDGTLYPNPDGRPAVGTLQWVQYQLDNAATIDDVTASDSRLRIASTGSVPLHFLVADATGSAATIEFLAGRMVVHRGKELPVPVLANESYEESLKNLPALPGGSNSSADRFARACRLVRQYQSQSNSQPIVEYAFAVLEDVAQGDWTKWSIVYDIADREVFFTSARSRQIKLIRLNALDFSCRAGPRMFDMNTPVIQPSRAKFPAVDISAELRAFSDHPYRKLLETAFSESRPRVMISEDRQQAIFDYGKFIRCQ
ncbi:MAG TPA: linear amide C-N hydrolase [Chitinophagaceae bacterium]|nr:linear amide C-N hydrolase [Chitinophagaceae bacterium]